MKGYLVVLSVFVFISCRSVDLKYRGEQCSPVFVYVDETRKLIDADKSYCNTRMYEMNINRIGSIPESDLKKPISYCDRCTGFKQYSQAATFWELVRREINEQQQRKEFEKGFSREAYEPASSSASNW
jgi:hypothetical protein